MTDRLRVGIVGASADGQGWAPISHFPALRTLPGFEIAAICTAHAGTAAAAAKVYGVERAYHDYNAMVREPDIDLISVVVKVPNHYQVVTAALNAGKHVYCEWPLGANLTETGAMVDVDAADNVLVNGVLQGGALASVHVATLPYHTTGWRMEIYGRGGTLRVSTKGSLQRDANTLLGSRGGEPMAMLPVPA